VNADNRKETKVMAQRTYVPQIVYILNRACKYIQKYSDQLKKYLTNTQYSLLQAVLAACVAFTDSIETVEPNP
jgi:hypothetical protein